MQKKPTTSFLSRVIDTLVPASCAICGNRLSVAEEFICAKCNLRLPRTYFELSPYDNPMARLLMGRFQFEKCASLFHYYSHSDSANTILALKYFQRTDYGHELGAFLAKQFDSAGFFDGITALMPMPLASNRERKRGYNQSREIVRGISSVTGLPMIDRVVERRKFKSSQTSMTRSMRNDNVEKGFALVDGSKLHGQHILLVDDVMTTGATLSACARAIEKADGVKISIATIGFAGHS